MAKYAYVIAGSGLFGATFAALATAQGKRCLVVEKRDHVAGNAYTKEIEGIQVHWYGPHIFHTNDDKVWAFARQYAAFNRFVNSPLANYQGAIYNLPFNMNTFNRLWGVITPEEAQAMIAKQREDCFVASPKNLEEQALSLVGRDIYEKLIKGYTEKQWGRPCTELDPSIIRRLPVRFTYDNNYYNAKYQGIPEDGYTAMVQRMLQGVEVSLKTDYLDDQTALESLADKVLYTGQIDAYYGFHFGALAYRHVHFEHEVLDVKDYQGNAVVNYTQRDIPYTRVIEHKHFAFGTQPKTVVTHEYSREWMPGMEPYYPIQSEENQAMLAQYQALADQEPKVIFGGRLGQYRYLDMDQVIASAMALYERIG